MVGRRDALADLVLQLRRSPGDLLGLPAARAGDGPDARAARAARVVVRVGLRARRAVRRHGRRPGPAEDRHPGRAAGVESHLRGDDDVARTSGTCSSCAPPRGSARPFYFPASMSLISDYHGRDTRSRAMGLHQTSVYVGTIGGGFFAGLIGQYYGWRLSFVVFGGLGILLGLVLRRFLIEPRARRGRCDGSDRRRMRRLRARRRCRCRRSSGSSRARRRCSA